jgi:hypothetical protein
MLWNCAACAVALATLCLVAPAGAFAWGANGHKLISNKAVDTLPPELRPFFEANRNFIVQHSTDPFDALAKNPVAERRNRILLLDRYGRFPFESLPRDYKAALAKFGKARLEANGVLPWQIGVYNEKLTNALRTRNWEEVRLLAALVSHYVAEAHDPFSTTENFDGKLSGQPGVNQRFGASLVDRFSLFFPVRPNDALYISASYHDQAFEACLTAHSWLEQILLADRRARKGLSDYTDEYYDRFYNQAGAIVIRQLTDAATDVGSYWLTAWRNAGQPALPPR